MKQKFLLCCLGVCLIILGACSSKEDQKEAKENSYTPQISFADAIKQSDEKAVKYYLNQDESPNQLDEEGTPFLVLAAMQDNTEIVQALLNAKAFVNPTNINGETALWAAVNNGNEDITDLLIAAGANINAANLDNMTPLMVASQNSYIINVDQLLQNGADISIKNKQGKTALALAAEQLQNQTNEDDFQTYNEIIAMLTEAEKPLIPAAIKAIAASDIDTFEILAPRIKTLPQEKQARLLYMASQVCVPNTTQICHLTSEGKPTEFPCIKNNLICDKKNNARIIQTLLKNGAASEGVTINYDNNSKDNFKLDIFSISYNLQKSNPELFNKVMPNLDKCMLALTQISHPNLTEADDALYQIYWLKNNCSLAKMNILGKQFTNSNKDKPTIAPLPKEAMEIVNNIAISKEDLTKQLGQPNFYQQQDKATEVLSYRKFEKAKTKRNEPEKINIVDDIYTLKYGVVIKYEHKIVASGLRPYVDRNKIAKYEQERGY